MEATVTPTRADYMAGRCTHRQFYAAICQTAGIVFDSDSPIVQRSRHALERGDEHLNTIRLRTWDSLGAAASHAIDRALRAHGDWPSLEGRCCVVKEAVRQAVERSTVITAELVRRSEPHTTMATGRYIDPQGRPCRWVAVRGGADDWAVYAGPDRYEATEVATDGDKIFPGSRYWPNGLNVTDDALALYRA